MKNKTKLSFQPPSWKKLQIMQIFPTATVAVAEGLKSLATAVELRPLVQHWLKQKHVHISNICVLRFVVDVLLFNVCVFKSHFCI